MTDDEVRGVMLARECAVVLCRLDDPDVEPDERDRLRVERGRFFYAACTATVPVWLAWSRELGRIFAHRHDYHKVLTA